MGLPARKARKDLSADSLFKRLHDSFDRIPDHRLGQPKISLGDALMSGFAVFSLKDPSLLAFDDRRDDPSDNFRTIYGIGYVPCDTQMRTILDPVNPDSLRTCFTDVFRCLQRGKILEDYVYFNGAGIDRNERQAMEWHRKAAEDGDTNLMNHLIFSYIGHDGSVPQNPQDIFAWCLKAAEFGDAGGMNGLGNCYFLGVGVSKNVTSQ